MENEKAISCLNDLIETCKDGQFGYQTAAEDVKDATLKSLFSEFAVQRGEFIGQLKAQVKALGGDPDTTGSIIGALHRGWINLKSALSSGDREAILAECNRGDSYAEGDYDKAMNAGLPANVAEVVSNQHVAVKAARNKIRSMEKVA
jgi:uncharacterized protein (TIGR02284 family)